MSRTNLHATGLVIGSQGLLIRGRSGAGKSTLALALLEACRARAVFAMLVADDQLWLQVRDGRLIAQAPTEIAGLVEVFGCGPCPTPFEPCSVIDRVVDLVEPARAPRHRDDGVSLVEGIELPHLVLPERSARAGVLAVMNWLDIPPAA